MRRILSYGEAMRIVVSSLRELGKERVPLDKSLGRVAAQDIRSPLDSPPFARSAVDGFACVGTDVLRASPSAPARLTLVGESLAGEISKKKVRRGECIEVATGTALPRGADCVVMKEYTRTDGETVVVEEKGHAMLNIALKGEDVKRGDVVTRKGRILAPQDLGMLKSCGIREVPVKVLPRLGIIVTGSELALDREALTPGKVLESNSLLLSSLAERCGCLVSFQRMVADEASLIEKAVRQGAQKSDLLLVTGGSSVGKKDLVAEVVKPLFSGVAIRPGRPLGFCARPPLLIMSGYPVACFMQFYAFVIPALEAMLSTKIQKTARGILQEKVASEVGRRDFVRVRLEDGLVYPVALRGSGIISSVTRSDGYIAVEEDREGCEKKERVTVNLWV